MTIPIDVNESLPPQTLGVEAPTHPRDAWTAEWGGLPEAAQATGLTIDDLMCDDPVGETRIPEWVVDLDQPNDPTITGDPGEPNPEGTKGPFHPPDQVVMLEDLVWGTPDPLDDSGALEAMALEEDEEDEDEEEEDTSHGRIRTPPRT